MKRKLMVQPRADLDRERHLLYLLNTLRKSSIALTRQSKQQLSVSASPLAAVQH